MLRNRRLLFVIVAVLGGLSGCFKPSDQLRIGVAFETLQTEYWVTSFEALEAELKRRNIERIEAIADNDANRQLDQIHILLARGVDGIMMSPKDATTVIPMMKAANRADVPTVVCTSPPCQSAHQFSPHFIGFFLAFPNFRS